MKSYKFKMKLAPANFLCIIIYIFLFVISFLLKIDFNFSSSNVLLVFALILIYFFIHELLHGIGYYLGGAKSCNIKYGIALEKGILYTLCRQEISKFGILLSLQMPFTVIGVITYIIGAIFNLPLLVLLSICNLGGAAMDMVMFIYILSIRNVRYTEADECDEFVLITDEDLTKRKNIFFEITEVKKYNKKDFKFADMKKFNITKKSITMIILFLLFGLILSVV